MAREQLNILMAQFDSMKQNRTLHEDPIQDIVDLMSPFRGDVTTMRSPGDLRIDGVFDSTSMIAAEGFSSLLKSSIIPSNIDWMRLEAPFERRDDLRIRKVADVTAQRMQRAMTQSNFDAQGGIFMRDFSIIGNATMFVQPRPRMLRGGLSSFGGLQFTSIFFTDMWWSMGAFNEVEIVVRHMRMSALSAWRFFGGNAGQHVMEKLRKQEWMSPADYLHFVYRNQDGVPGGLRPPDKMPWISHWVAIGPDQGPEEIRVRGFDLNPYIVARWTIVRQETYGTGIGHLVRPDAAGLNELARQILIAAGRDLNPAILLEDESIIDLDTGPNGVIVVRPFQKQPPQFLPTGTRYDIAQEVRLHDRSRVEDAFMADLFKDPETQPRSAFESQAREQRGFSRFAAPADTTANEFLGPLVTVVMQIMLDQGALPELEDLLDAEDEITFGVEFVSPFFAAQKAEPIRRISAFLERRLTLFERTQDPEYLIDINPRAVTAVDRRLADVPAEIFFTEEEVQARLAANEQAAKEQRLLEAADTAANVARAAGDNPQLAQTVSQLAAS